MNFKKQRALGRVAGQILRSKISIISNVFVVLNANASKNSYWTAQKDEVGYHKTIQNASGEMEKTFYWASQEVRGGWNTNCDVYHCKLSG